MGIEHPAIREIMNTGYAYDDPRGQDPVPEYEEEYDD